MSLSATDIYDFAGWLTTRPGTLTIGSSHEAGPMADAVVEYLRAFPERFRQQSEAMTRFCPGCGSVGPVPDPYHDCCPDGDKARMIPEALARHCRDLFQLALSAPGDALHPQQPAAQPVAYMVTKRVDVGIGVTRDVVLSWEPGLPDEPSEPLYTHPIYAAEVLRLADEYARKVALADHGHPADEVKVKQARAALAREVGSKE